MKPLPRGRLLCCNIIENVFRPIAKGVTVAFYSGEVLTAKQLDDRYPGFEGSDYVMKLGPDQYLDARDPEKSSIARWDSRPVTGWVGFVLDLFFWIC